MKTKFLLPLIIILGVLLRIIFINSSPPSLYGDELTITLDAYSLLKTGHDQLGNFLPLTFKMGAGRPAGYVYATIPFVAIFGPTALGVRALSILSGIGIIILLYYLCRKLFSEKLGLIAAFIASVSPWDISLSRGGFEAHFALFLALLGLYLFIKAKDKPLLYIFSALSFGLTIHTYPTYKIGLLLFLPLLFSFQNRSKDILKKKYFIAGFLILTFFGLLSLSQTFTSGSETRFSDINIFAQSNIKNTIEQKIDFERKIINLPGFYSKYFHNKPVEYAKVLIDNYMQNFSADFLFLHGDRNPRHNMATIGEFYAVDIILILIGLLTFWAKYKKEIIFLLLWIILSPIPTAIIDLPHALRSSFMLPPILILSSMGLYTLISLRNKIPVFLITSLFIIQFIFFTQKLYFLSPDEYGDFWSYPAKLTTDLAVQNKNKYDYIILSDQINDIEFAYPVYTKVDPNLIIAQNKKRSLLAGVEFKKIENVYIGYIPEGNISQFIKNLNGSVLYIGNLASKNYLKNYETIYGKDGLLKLTLVKKQTK